MIKVLDTENCGISKTWLCQGKNRGTTVNCSVKNADCPYFPDTSRITSFITREERLSYSHKTLYIKPCQGQDCGEEYPIMVDQDYSTMQKFARGETAVAINPQTSYDTVILTACQGKVCKHYHNKRYHSYHSSDMLVAGGKIALGLIPNRYSFKPGTLYVCNGSSCVTYEVQTNASDDYSNYKITTQYVKLYAGEKPLAVIPKTYFSSGNIPTDIVACNGTDCSIYTVSIPSEYLKNISVTKNPDNYTVTYYDAGLQKYQTYTCTGTLCTREGK